MSNESMEVFREDLQNALNRLLAARGVGPVLVCGDARMTIQGHLATFNLFSTYEDDVITKWDRETLNVTIAFSTHPAE